MARQVFLYVLCGLLGAWHLAQGLRARRSGFYTFGWGGGLLLRGKSVPWPVMVGTGTVLVAAAIVAARFGFASDEPFSFRIPTGWLDLSPPAASEKLAAAATITDGDAQAFFEAHVAKGAWRPSLESVRAVAASNVRQVSTGGAAPRIGDVELVDVDGVRAGRYTVTVEGPRGTMKMLVYALPGLHAHATVSYGADARIYDKHLPEVLAAIKKTDGIATPMAYPYPVYLPLAAMAIAALVVIGAARTRRTFEAVDG